MLRVVFVAAFGNRRIRPTGGNRCCELRVCETRANHRIRLSEDALAGVGIVCQERYRGSTEVMCNPCPNLLVVGPKFCNGDGVTCVRLFQGADSNGSVRLGADGGVVKQYVLP